jgi:hypothetical protein
LTYSFTLRDGLKWHDGHTGKPLKAVSAEEVIVVGRAAHFLERCVVLIHRKAGGL